ncbi:hypothetical protein F3Y22_tig00111105pilonHSYRG00528 [Hibiscus syriacus]|uniref:VAN3-binding protein-like auxin canalisation domain-containing protein n=1 Tax=Hibiscus syriacus TaxID=106335 RepID=A0A6A2Z048_HIBSY|nr:hypothetical protein F3Y22_tig00111105pilonHSYRG00528 [Hibiscus syriacus]
MDEPMTKTDMVMASTVTLVAAQCMEAAEAMRAEHEHLASVISSAVNVWTVEYTTTLNADVATGVEGSMKHSSYYSSGERRCNDSNGGSNGDFSDEHLSDENLLGICIRELLAKGCVLLKCTSKGHFHPCFNFIFLDDGENWRYFGLKKAMHEVLEFECKNQKEHDVSTQGVCRGYSP